MDREYVKHVKNEIRQRIWRLLEELNIADFPRPVYGRIPNFKGSNVAAQRISLLGEWIKAEVVKSNPDSPQYHIRLRALFEEKVLLMATPRLRSGFILLKPSLIPKSRLHTAVTIQGSFKYGKLVRLSEIPPIDLVVTGCVAVDKYGVRLGKGGGFSELEYGILRELGLINEKTPIVTTIHDVQVVDDKIPLEIHDLTIDYYATPTVLMKIENPVRHRPRGIYWEILSDSLRELGVIRELIELKKI